MKENTSFNVIQEAAISNASTFWVHLHFEYIHISNASTSRMHRHLKVSLTISSTQLGRLNPIQKRYPLDYSENRIIGPKACRMLRIAADLIHFNDNPLCSICTKGHPIWHMHTYNHSFCTRYKNNWGTHVFGTTFVLAISIRPTEHLNLRSIYSETYGIKTNKLISTFRRKSNQPT